jgi:ribosomal protein S18 acetylase RimI-like enzyme
MMLNLRTCTPSDAEALSGLGQRTFIETFAKDNTPEDIGLFVSQTYTVENQLQEIQDPQRRIGIAWEGNEAVGYYHLKIGVPDPSVTGPKPVEILRLYVDSRFHGKGVARALMDRCLEIARSEGFETVWLGVWEHNHRAQAFYRKYGFVPVGAHDFVLGTDVQTDLVFARPL